MIFATRSDLVVKTKHTETFIWWVTVRTNSTATKQIAYGTQFFLAPCGSKSSYSDERIEIWDVVHNTMCVNALSVSVWVQTHIHFKKSKLFYVTV